MKNKSLPLFSLFKYGALPVVFGLLASPVLLADDKPGDTKAKDGQAPDMEQMMKKMEELAAPGPEHKILTALVGEWEAQAQCYMAGPDAAPTVSKGIAKTKWILGGRFVQEEFDGEMMGKKFHGLGLTGYDKFNKKYIS